MGVSRRITSTHAALALFAVLVGGVTNARADRPNRVTVTEIGGHYAEVSGEGRRTVLLLPRGGWQADGPDAVRGLRPVARRVVAMGWRAISLSYANGSAGMSTVRAGWRLATRDGPACVYGESSGGHWALLLASRDASVHCVIAAAAPTDLVSWPDQLRSSAARAEADGLRSAAFGTDAATLRKASPATTWRARDCARVLLINAENDALVPVAQARELEHHARGSRLLVLRAGSEPWVHSSVRPADLESAWRAIRRTLADRSPGCARP